MTAPPAPKKTRRSKEPMPNESIVCEDDEADSPYTLYFVQLPDGKPTEKETVNFETLFKVSQDSGLMPEMIDETAVDRIHSSDDFFVLPCFRGKLFRKMQARKLRLFGPPIVFESLEEGKQLPQWTHPIFSSVFEGAKISFTAIDPEKKRELKEIVSWMGGVVGDSLYHESTHLVAGRAEQSEKYKMAVKNSIKLMRTEWIEELWDTSKSTMGKFSAITRDAVNTYSLRVFEGLEMAVTSIDGEDRTRLALLVEEHGGKMPGNMSRSRCSHLITDSTNSQKYKKALEWKNVIVVQTRWVRKCIDLGHLIDETKYHPKLLSVEHMRSSTPKRDMNLTETGPDVSSIAGRGGRLSISSFNASSLAITQQNRAPGASFISTQSSNVTSSTVNKEQTHIRPARSYEQFTTPAVRPVSTPLARTHTVPLIRQPSVVIKDPIDDLLQMINDNHAELFENLMIYVCGVEEANMLKWRRFVDVTGGTRVRKFESATNVIVVAPNAQEKITLRKFSSRDDIAITNSNWIRECLKEEKIVPHEDFEWNDTPMDDSMPQQTASDTQNLSNTTDATMVTSYSEPPPTKVRGIFATRTYFVHGSMNKNLADDITHKIVSNGGIMEKVAEKAEFVVFGHSAMVHELLRFDTVITDLYINACLLKKEHVKLSDHPLFVPLPSPPIQVFNMRRCVLSSNCELIYNYVKSIIESKGGIVCEQYDSKSVIVTLGKDSIPLNLRSQTVDLSWVISSMSKCHSQPITDHLYQSGSEPLDNYQREDDVWIKCMKEKDVTQEMEAEVEDRHQVEGPRQDERISNFLAACPTENPYFPDLRKPYKMQLNLDGISEIIDNIPSPSQRDSPDSLTKSFVGRVLRKAVQNTGRTHDEQEQRPPSVVVAENRRTVSSTPVLQRKQNRSEPMNERVIEQNQEHVEELNRRYAMHPHFLLTTSDAEFTSQLTEMICELGGIIEKEFTRDVSILICLKLARTPKTLSTIAAGKWCLKPDYVIKSVEAGHWLDEEQFEWGPEDMGSDSTEIEKQLAAVIKPWRIHVANMPITHSVSTESRHNGAFSGWRCVVHVEDKKALAICPIIEAGGAVVFSITEYIEVSNHQPTVALANARFAWHEQSAEFLRRDGIPLYNFDVIYDFLVNRETQDRSKYLHPSYCRN